MEYLDGGSIVAAVVAGVIEDEGGTSTQLPVRLDMQLEESKEWMDLDTNFIDNGAGMCEDQKDANVDCGGPTLHVELPHNASLPPQEVMELEVIDLVDESESSKDLPDIIAPTYSSVAPVNNLSGVANTQTDTDHDESPHNTLLPRKKAIIIADSCKDLTKVMATSNVVAPDCDVKCLCVVSAPKHTSLKERSKNPGNQIGTSVHNHQHYRNVGKLEEKVNEVAGCSSKSTAYHGTTTELRKRSFAPNALLETLLRTCLALEEEKQSEEYVLVTISRCLHKVSIKSSDVQSSALALFGDLVTVENLDDSRCSDTAAVLEEKVVGLDSRLIAVEDYVRDAYAEVFKQVDMNVPYRELRTQQAGSAIWKTSSTRIPPTVMNKSSSLTCGNSLPNVSDVERGSALLLHLMEFVAHLRNKFVREHRKLSKLRAVGEVCVEKIEVSCRIVLNAVKSIANVVRPSLEATRILQRALCRVGKLKTLGTPINDPPAELDVTIPVKLANSALTHAEAAIRLHGEVALVLKEARKQLEILKLNEGVGRDILQHGNHFEKYVLELIQNPGDINFHEVREKKTAVALMGDLLSHIVKEMMLPPALLTNSSEKSSRTVRKVLRSLSCATEDSCSAMETSLDALIKVALSTRISDRTERRKSRVFFCNKKS